MKLKVNHLQQRTSNSCGLAALRMIFDYYGDKITEEELDHQLKIHSFGVFSNDLGTLALKRGYKVTSHTFHLPALGSLGLPFGAVITNKILDKVNLKSKDKMTFVSWQNYLEAGGLLIWDYPQISLIQKYLSKKAPCLVSVNTAALGNYHKKWNNGHYLVATGFEREKVHVLDPDHTKKYGSYFIKNEIFLPSWSINSFNSSDFLMVIEK